MIILHGHMQSLKGNGQSVSSHVVTRSRDRHSEFFQSFGMGNVGVGVPFEADSQSRRGADSDYITIAIPSDRSDALLIGEHIDTLVRQNGRQEDGETENAHLLPKCLESSSWSGRFTQADFFKMLLRAVWGSLLILALGWSLAYSHNHSFAEMTMSADVAARTGMNRRLLREREGSCASITARIFTICGTIGTCTSMRRPNCSSSTRRRR